MDTDVLIDLLTERSPYFASAAKLFMHIQDKRILAFISPVVIATLSYILSKRFNRQRSISLLRKLNILVEVLAIDQKIIDLALSSEFSDFEDSIQYYSAIENGIKILTTRNIKDYDLAQIRIFRPTEFLAEL